MADIEGFEVTARSIKNWLEDSNNPEPHRLSVKQYRGKLLDTAKAINNRASLTDAEKKDYEGIMQKVATCNEALRRMEYTDEINRAMLMREDDPSAGKSGPFMRSGEKLSEKYHPVQRGTIGGMVRAMILGDYQNMPEEARSMSVGGSAGYAVPEAMAAQIIDLARNKSALFRSGAASFLPMGAETVRVPRLTTGPVAEWHTENQALTGSDAEFGSVFLQAKTVACLLTMSVELVEDAVGLDSFLQNAIAEALALEIDRAAISGIGASGQPGGILNDEDVQTHAISSAEFPSYGQIMEMSGKLDEENAPEGRSYLVHPKINTLIDTAKDGLGNYLYQIPVAANKLRRIITNQIPVGVTAGGSDKTSPIIMLAPESCCFGLRTNFVLEASRTSGDSFKNMQVQLRGYWRGDFGILRPKHIIYSTGIKYE